MVDGAEAFGLGVDIASGVLFILLGIAMALLRPRRSVNVAFAVFSSTFGAVFVLLNLSPAYFDLLPATATNVQTVLNLVWGASLVLVALLFPRPFKPKELRRAWWAAAVTMLLAVPVLGALPFGLESSGTVLQGLDGAAAAAYAVSDSLAYLALGFFILAGAFRLPRTPGRSGHVMHRRLAHATAAVLPYYGLLFGALAADAGDQAWGLVAILAYLAFCAVAGLFWGAHALRTAADRAAAWATAAAAFLFPVAGFLIGATVGSGWLYSSGLLGATRILGVAVLAYGIARQQVFDIDLRLRWTIKQSSLAAFFVTVFFIASESAQQVASQSIGPYLGIAAASCLVFAIAPLQRLADRLSRAAVPGDSDPPSILRRKRETYRNAYETAWSDGILTAKDVRLLHELRDALGLSVTVTNAIETESNRLAV